MYVSVILGFFVAIFQAVNGDDPCPGAPQCFPTGNITAGTTCISSAENGTDTNWYEMENVCKSDDGRLVWLREDLTLLRLLTSVKNHQGALVATGLLYSPTHLGGLFWGNPNDNSSVQCDNTDTSQCLVNRTEDKCTAMGCCWKNSQCLYPSSQTLPTFTVNKTELALTNSTQRQCVGYQLNANSSVHGQWVSYDCFQPVRKAVYVCEYKCNSANWPKTNTTNFLSQTPVTGTLQAIVSTMKPNVKPPNPGNGTPQGTGAVGNVKPGTNQQTQTNGTSQGTGSGVNPTAHPQTPDNGTPQANTGSVKPVTVGPQGLGSNCDNKSVSAATGGTQGSYVKLGSNSLLKVLLSLETGGANTNMSFSLEQTLP